DGSLARVRDGDVIRLDARAGTLEVRVDAATLAARELAPRNSTPPPAPAASCSPRSARMPPTRNPARGAAIHEPAHARHPAPGPGGTGDRGPRPGACRAAG